MISGLYGTGTANSTVYSTGTWYVKLVVMGPACGMGYKIFA